MALGPLYLADKSAWEQGRYDDHARQRLLDLRQTRQLAICVVSLAELLYSARNAEILARMRRDLAALPYLQMTPAAEHRMADVMGALARRDQHRTPVPDLMLASIAQVHGAVVLHYDSDYERIAGVTEQPHEWIVPRGTGHGNRTN